MNLDGSPRNDFVTVDINLCPMGHRMVNLLNPEKELTIEERAQRHTVRIPLDSHEMVILKS
jgi:hypothetical protein